MTIDQVDVLILCGGLGTRLRSTIGESQKVMADVQGKPFLDYHIDHLQAQGVERIILCTGFQADDVESYYRNKDNEIAIDFAREEEPLGTGGALKNAQPIVWSDHFILLNGDSFCPFDVKYFLKKHFESEAIASVGISRKDDVRDYGTVEINKDNLITAFKEKEDVKKSGFVNAGIYCFTQKAFEYMPEEGKFSLEYDVFPNLTEHKLNGIIIEKEFSDIGTPERYQEFKNK
ncbi:MAG: D-glycero-alpha-D-manno-heptose 1-phosphate guanylyltransferase [Lysobacterales bacterium]|jgi:D-glycero-alpha-D-manno-heptose 1-phosphate guanylyltransferase